MQRFGMQCGLKPWGSNPKLFKRMTPKPSKSRALNPKSKHRILSTLKKASGVNLIAKP